MAPAPSLTDDETAAAPRVGATAFPPLPAELTIYTAADTHAQWLAWWHQHAAQAHDAIEVEADAAAVDSVDGAGVQLLLSLSHLLQRENRTLRLQRPSDVLRAACTTLGASVLLGEPEVAR